MKCTKIINFFTKNDPRAVTVLNYGASPHNGFNYGASPHNGAEYAEYAEYADMIPYDPI